MLPHENLHENLKHIPHESLSIWMKTASPPEFFPLNTDMSVDSCIIGAGIAGLTTAYYLCLQGQRVAVLDNGPIGDGQTGRSTAHFTAVLDQRYRKLARAHGEARARKVADSHRSALRMAQNVIHTEMIDCDAKVVNGYLFSHASENSELHKEWETVRQMGFFDCQMMARTPSLPPESGPCLVFPGQLQIHPLKYIYGLALAIQRRGGLIFTGTHVTGISERPHPVVKTSSGYRVRANHIVVATNTPFNDAVAVHTKQYSYRTYVIAAKIPKDAVQSGLYWDTQDPYHYVRIQSHTDSEDLLIVGGEDHKTGQQNDTYLGYEKLEAWTRTHFPQSGGVVQRWSGQIMETADGLAFIGRNPFSEKVFVVTGHSGNGLSYGTLGGRLISDLILEKPNPWAEVYSPSRLPLGSWRKYLRENANALAQYRDWVTAKPHAPALKIGEGVIVRRGLRNIAVLKAENGATSECSAICTHLGGIVRWNAAEKTWDCPCHGSRFNAAGTVIEGPSNKNLRKLDRKSTSTEKSPRPWRFQPEPSKS